MTPRSLATLWLVALLAVVLTGTGIVLGYGGAAPYLVKVSGPRGAVDCGETVRLTTTVVGIENGTPVAQQYVRWKVDRGSSGDKLSDRLSTTDKKGRTSVTLTLAKAAGDRRIVATAAGIPGRATIKVRCAQPTPRPTQKPDVRSTPRPTRKPRATPGPTPRPTTAPAGLERAALTVGYLDPALSGRAPFVLADASGAWKDRGLETVTQVEAPDPLPGLLDGTLDVAVMPLDAALEAIADGRPITILAAYHDYRSDIVAVGPGITGPADLGGKPVILGDDARVAERGALLAEGGWDLSGVEVQETLPEGGFDAWAAALVNGDAAMAPILNRHRLMIQQADGTLALDRQLYGNDVLVAADTTVAAAPRTLTAFLAGTIASLQRLTDPATDQELFAAARDAGIDEPDRTGWTADVEDFRPWDGSFGDADTGGGLAELDAHARALLGWVPLPADELALDLLNAAQVDAGLEPAPALTPLAAPAGGPLVIGVAGDDLGVRGPLLLARATGAFDAAGLGDVTLATGDGIAGILDGSMGLAVVTAAAATAAVDAGSPIVVVAGYQPAAAEPTVLIAGADADEATVSAALQAILRGLAAMNRPDAFDLAVSASGGPASEDAAAAWTDTLPTFAPFDGSMASGAAPGAALEAARTSLGLEVAG